MYEFSDGVWIVKSSRVPASFGAPMINSNWGGRRRSGFSGGDESGSYDGEEHE